MSKKKRGKRLHIPMVIADEIYSYATRPSVLMMLLERDPHVVEWRQQVDRWADDGGAL